VRLFSTENDRQLPEKDYLYNYLKDYLMAFLEPLEALCYEASSGFFCGVLLPFAHALATVRP